MARDNTTLSDAYRDFITRAAKSGTLSVEGINAFMKERGGNPVTNAAEVVDFYKQFGTVSPTLIVREKPDATYDPSKPESAVNVLPDSPASLKARDIAKQVDDAGYGVNLTRAVAKGALFDFADELEAATRMLSEGKISADEYYRIKNQINTDYAAWAEANPGTALSAELGGGLATTFIPGVGLAGKAIQGATRIGKIASPTGRAAATGALSGVVSGVGAAPTAQDIPAEVLISGGLGAGLSAALPVVGRAGLRVYETGRRRLAGEAPVDTATQRAAEITYDALRRSGLTPEQAADRVRLERQYGAPVVFGDVSPTLSRTMETVAVTPSEGQEKLLETLVTRQKEAPQRVEKSLRTSFRDPANYYATEDEIAENLSTIGDEDYARARAVGNVNDPVLQELLTESPALGRAFEKAAEDAKELVADAIEKGEDPSLYKLSKLYEPIFDDRGQLAGHKYLGKVPDVNTLHMMKVALDKQITAAFKNGDANATMLKTARNALVRRLDKAVPEYQVARAKYAGELEVRDALRTGTEVFSKAYDPEELSRFMKDMSEAEKEALRIGAFKAVTKPIGSTSQARNFANEIINNPEAKEKLRLMLPKQQFDVLDAALSRDADLYKRTSKMMTGSRTYPLLKEGQTIDDAIEGGTVQDVVSVLTNPSPGNFARVGARIVMTLARGGKKFEDKVYTQLANILKSGTPQELAETVVMLRDHAAALARKGAVEGQAAGRASVVAGGAAGTPLEQDAYAKPPRATTANRSAKVDPIEALRDIQRQALEITGPLAVEVPVEAEPAAAPAMDMAEPTLAPSPNLQ